MQELYKAQEMATLLKCNVQTVYRMGDKGLLGSIKVGSLRRFFLLEEKGQNNDAERENFEMAE